MSMISRRVGHVELPLRVRLPRLMPSVQRSMSEVHPKLLATLRSLVTGNAPWPLFLYGNVGAGKTLAALCLADVMRTAVYHTVEDLCSRILELRDDHAAVRETWEMIAGKNLAILDELGTRQNVSDYHYATVKRFADARELHAGRVAIYISNLSHAELTKLYDSRIVSRLICGTRFELKGRDRRVFQ